MPTTTSMLSRNSCWRAGHETSPRSPPGMSPAKKFSPDSWTPASRTAATNASTSASAGTAEANGHQNSTASKPAALTAAGRSSSGSSVKSSEQFTVYRRVFAGLDIRLAFQLVSVIRKTFTV